MLDRIMGAAVALLAISAVLLGLIVHDYAMASFDLLMVLVARAYFYTPPQ